MFGPSSWPLWPHRSLLYDWTCSRFHNCTLSVLARMWTETSVYGRASLISLSMRVLNVHFTGNKIYHHVFVCEQCCVCLSVCVCVYARVPACICVFVWACAYICLSALPMFCSLFLVPRTACQRVDDHRLFVKIQTDDEQLAAPAARDRVSWGCEQLQWDVWLDSERSNNDVVCVKTKDPQRRSELRMWK